MRKLLKFATVKMNDKVMVYNLKKGVEVANVTKVRKSTFQVTGKKGALHTFHMPINGLCDGYGHELVARV